ncbi:hypothetical protein DL764_000301 [Monosporascus ibericus]|uniref:Uncharacterized protein n=1 Tax=Monosporascus ibericus TaxID=155417 RepID=A0A4Q4TWM0_9PEZI|nr:hypothetical protein DL764_000301 [Monosporascus ibericus]
MDSATGNSPTARPASNSGSDSTYVSEPPFEPMPDAHQTTGDYTGARELALWGPLVVNGLVRVASDIYVGATGSLCVRVPFKAGAGADETIDEVSVMGQLIVCKDAKLPLGKVIVLGDVILEDMTLLYALSNDQTVWK